MPLFNCSRLVDFQLSHYNSYAWDLSYFLYTSVRPEIRLPHMAELLKIYAGVLNSTFQNYNFSTDNIPTLGNVENEMKRLSLAQIVFSCVMLPLNTAEPNEAVDLATLIDPEVKDYNKKTKKMYMNTKFTKAIKETLTYFIESDLLK